MAFTYGEGSWVFVCRPSLWYVDDFLRSGNRTDTWALDDRYLTIPPRPGDLAFIRAGNDTRNKSALNGHPKLEPGIYALVEITSNIFVGEGVSSKFWHGGDEPPHEPGAKYSTVSWQLVASFLHAPLTVEKIKRSLPGVQGQVLEQPQARSYPLSRSDFFALLDLAGVDDEQLPTLLSSTPTDLGPITPGRKEVLQKRWERGNEGRLAKDANGHRCQICQVLSRESVAFVKPDGVPYVEAHHVVPVSRGSAGLLDPANIITVCANHHRELHYGGVPDPEDAGDCYVFQFREGPLRIPKLKIHRPR